MAKYTKNELIENVARNTNNAEIFYKAANAATTGNELCKLNLTEAAQKVEYAVMWLNKLHENKYRDEWNNADKIVTELKAIPAQDITYEEIRKEREMITAVNCIIKYNENYFKEEEGYL